MSRSRAWCFTLNNYTDADESLLQQVECDYIVFGRETGEEKEVPHLQGYIYFKNPKRLGGLKKLHSRAHWETAKGTAEQNFTYCTKQGDFYERGSKPQQGKRNDLAEIREIIKAGGGMEQVIEKASNYQALRAGELLLKYQKAPHRPEREIYWYYGPTGSGKTRAATQEAETRGSYWISGKSLKWWDGYDGEKQVIIDDFRADFCTFHELLRLFDIYPMRVEFKGGSRPLMATAIWVTCPYPPTAVWKNKTEEDLEQLTRRIHTIKPFGDYQEPAVLEVDGYEFAQ